LFSSIALTVGLWLGLGLGIRLRLDLVSGWSLAISTITFYYAKKKHDIHTSIHQYSSNIKAHK